MFCTIRLDTQILPNPYANGDDGQGKLRVKVRDAVSGTVFLNQQFSLAPFTSWEDRFATITTSGWFPPSSRRVVVNLIADRADPHSVNLYTVDNLQLVCAPF